MSVIFEARCLALQVASDKSASAADVLPLARLFEAYLIAPVDEQECETVPEHEPPPPIDQTLQPTWGWGRK
jgi:hypothetical protein